jgi:hypothetical protein
VVGGGKERERERMREQRKERRGGEGRGLVICGQTASGLLKPMVSLSDLQPSAVGRQVIWVPKL